MNGKLIEFQKDLQIEGLNAFFVTNTTNVYYFTKFLSHSYAYLIIYPERTPYLFVPELEYEDAVNKVKNAEVVKIDRNNEIIQVIKRNLEDNEVKKLGIEDNSMSVNLYLDISEKYDFLKLERGSKLIEKLRLTKTLDEIEKLKKACQISDIGFTVAVQNIEEGKTEIEISTEIEYIMRKKGSEGAPFDTIVASGYRSALPHGVSSNKKIEQGDFIIIDIGAKYEGYCSDMARTVTLGAPNQRQLEIYNAVLETQRKAVNSCCIGENVVNIEKDARNLLSKAGLNKYFVHSLGHGVGLDVHELPYIALKSKDVLMENSIFTIEPGVYIPDFGGVRIEDVMLLTKSGAEFLTKSEYTI